MRGGKKSQELLWTVARFELEINWKAIWRNWLDMGLRDSELRLYAEAFTRVLAECKTADR